MFIIIIIFHIHLYNVASFVFTVVSLYKIILYVKIFSKHSQRFIVKSMGITYSIYVGACF